MDELKPSPRNELLYSLAQKLRAAPAALGRANPILGRLAEGALGDIPKGLEHYAYGDSPLGPPANAPLLRTDRALPMLEAAPIGAAMKAPGAVSSAMLIGASPTDPKVQTLLKLLRLGATGEEAWQDTGRAIVPTRPGYLKSPIHENQPFVKEVSDLGYRGKPDMQWTLGEKESLANKLDPIQRPAALERAKYADLFLPGRWKLGDLIEHPELFRERPDLPDLKVHIDPKETGYGSYSPTNRSITLGTKTFLENPGKGHKSTILHELMHDQQRVFGMPGGYNVKRATLKPEERDKLARTYDFFNKNKIAGNDPDLMYNMYNMTQYRNAPYKLYRNVLGEQQARAVQERLSMPDSLRAENSPTASYDNLNDGIHPAYADYIIKMLREQPAVP